MSPEAVLKHAEAAAIRAHRDQKEASRSLKEAEESPTSPDEDFSYTPTGASPSRFSRSPSANARLKKFAPIIALVVLLFGGGAFIMSAISLLPAHLDENGQKSWDIQHAAAKIAMKVLTKKALSSGSLPSGFADRLASAGIEVGYLDSNSNFIAGLRPTSDAVLASAETSTDSLAVDSPSTSSDSSLVLRWQGSILDADTFAAYFEENPAFYASFSDATYGRAIGHYDSAALDFYDNLSSTRDVFSDYIATGNNTTDTEAYKSKLAEIFSTTTNSSANNLMDVTYNLTSDVTFAKGFYHAVEGYYYRSYDNYLAHLDNPPAQCLYPNSGCIVINSPRQACDVYSTIHSVKTKFEGSTCYAEVSSTNATASAVDSYLDNLTSSSLSLSSSAANERAVSLLNTAVNANETYQSMSFFLTIEEAIAKMKAGNGAESPINSILNFLTTSTTSSYGTGAPVQAPGLAAVLTQNFSSNLAEETSAFSLDRFLSSASVSSDNFSEIAASTKYNSHETNIIRDFGNFFVGKIQDMQSSATTGFIAALNPDISQSLLFTSAGDLTGLAAGETFARGGSALGSHIATFAQGGTLGDESAVLAYAKTTDHVLALDAAADRATRSPFDISSPNTFLGSIFANLSSTFATSSSALSTFSSLSSLTTNSLFHLLPGASAASSDEQSYQTTFSNACPTLSSTSSTRYASGASIGFVEKGDIYCNPIITFDTNTIETAFDSAEFNSFLAQNLNDSSDAPVAGSDLDMFMKYNSGRQSTFATKNSNIYSEIVDETSVSDAINPVAGSGARSKNFFNRLWTKTKNFFGRIKDFFSSLFHTSPLETTLSDIKTDSHLASDRIDRISTGEEFTNTPGAYWDTYKYAQAYILYSRILDQMDYFDLSNTNTTSISAYFPPATGSSPAGSYIASVTAVPADETDAEYLSRISGLTPAESDYVLALVTYNSYLATLDYSSYLAFGETAIKDLPAPLYPQEDSDSALLSISIFSDQKSTPEYEKRRLVAYVA